MGLGDFVDEGGAAAGAGRPCPRRCLAATGARGFRGSVRLGCAAGARLRPRGLSAGMSRSSSRATTAMVPSGVPSSCAAAAASAPRSERRCSRARAAWVGGERGLHAARFVGGAPGVDQAEADAERERDPDAGDVERRQRAAGSAGPRAAASGRTRSTRCCRRRAARGASVAPRLKFVAEITTGAR